MVDWLGCFEIQSGMWVPVFPDPCGGSDLVACQEIQSGKWVPVYEGDIGNCSGPFYGCRLVESGEWVPVLELDGYSDTSELVAECCSSSFSSSSSSSSSSISSTSASSLSSAEVGCLYCTGKTPKYIRVIFSGVQTNCGDCCYEPPPDPNGAGNEFICSDVNGTYLLENNSWPGDDDECIWFGSFSKSATKIIYNNDNPGGASCTGSVNSTETFSYFNVLLNRFASNKWGIYATFSSDNTTPGMTWGIVFTPYLTYTGAAYCSGIYKGYPNGAWISDLCYRVGRGDGVCDIYGL